MKIAYFSPLNPAPTGISDYSEELLPYLASYADVEIFVDGYAPTNADISKRFRVSDWSAFDARKFDINLYQLGNSPAHGYIYRLALEQPGVIVLHDWVLHHLVAWLTLNHGDMEGYVEAMRKAYGETGAELARREIVSPGELDRFEYPLSETVVRGAKGVIAHSFYVARLVESAAPQMPVAKINHGIPQTPLMAQEEARERLGLPLDAQLIGALGNAGPTKRSTILLEALREVRRELPGARLYMVGDISPNYDPRGLVEQFGLQDAVVMTGKVPFEQLNLYAAAMDVCVSLRYPTAGETSGAVLRMMAQAKPVIVSRVGWFAEIHDDACAKIDVDDAEREMLGVTLARLLKDGELREAIGTNARRYVVEGCSIEGAAAGYADFLQAVVENRAESMVYEERKAQPPTTDGRPRVADGRPPTMESRQRTEEQLPTTETGDLRWAVAQEYVSLGLDSSDAALRAVAQALVELGLSDE